VSGVVVWRPAELAEEEEEEEEEDKEEEHAQLESSKGQEIASPSQHAVEVDDPGETSPGPRASPKGVEEDERSEPPETEKANKKKWSERKMRKIVERGARPTDRDQVIALQKWVSLKQEAHLSKFGQRTFSPNRAAIRKRRMELGRRSSLGDQPMGSQQNTVQVVRMSETPGWRFPNDDEKDISDFLMGKEPSTVTTSRRSQQTPQQHSFDAVEEEEEEGTWTDEPQQAWMPFRGLEIGGTNQQSGKVHKQRRSKRKQERRDALEEKMEERTIFNLERIAEQRKRALQQRQKEKELPSMGGNADAGDGNPEESDDHDERQIIQRIESVVRRKKRRAAERSRKRADARQESSFLAAGEEREDDEMVWTDQDENVRDKERKWTERKIIESIERAVKNQKQRALQATQLRQRREMQVKQQMAQMRVVEQAAQGQADQIEKLLQEKRRKSVRASMAQRRTQGLATSVPDSQEEREQSVMEIKKLLERKRQEQAEEKRKREQEERQRKEAKRALAEQDRQRVALVRQYWLARLN